MSSFTTTFYCGGYTTSEVGYFINTVGYLIVATINKFTVTPSVNDVTINSSSTLPSFFCPKSDNFISGQVIFTDNAGDSEAGQGHHYIGYATIDMDGKINFFKNYNKDPFTAGITYSFESGKILLMWTNAEYSVETTLASGYSCSLQLAEGNSQPVEDYVEELELEKEKKNSIIKNIEEQEDCDQRSAEDYDKNIEEQEDYSLQLAGGYDHRSVEDCDVEDLELENDKKNTDTPK